MDEVCKSVAAKPHRPDFTWNETLDLRLVPVLKSSISEVRIDDSSLTVALSAVSVDPPPRWWIWCWVSRTRVVVVGFSLYDGELENLEYGFGLRSESSNSDSSSESSTSRSSDSDESDD
ncbi:hypothetical protein OGAPHI_004580 [Ogataea philodendri]|uniref:Uncharacterized protein n=1 Tax=Ogataea philodendri TaxID=1378263 RepID=A0A9P8P3Y2_9ASCO|nr:uncharacterized protein OGAPHI_004580 [Ogataea philodendri]KAH3664229.1 hypothetical protein OGAPHI_004580 [Ogataea philodendri]